MLNKVPPAATLAPAMFLLLGGCGYPPDTHDGPVRRDTQSIELGKTESTRVTLRMGAGELRMSGGSPKLVDAEFSFNDPDGKPRMQYSATGSRGQLNIEQPGGMHTGANREYRWDLRFNDTQPLDLEAHFGAGQAKLNLGSLNLRSVEVNMGVGELDMDLRGAPSHDYDVRVHGGVGEATIRLPKDVGIKAEATGGIGDIDVHGLEKRGGRWINPGHEDAKVTIHLDVSGGVGSIRLLAE